VKKLTVVLTGGLGNQLFQIQFARYVKKQTNCEIFFDIALGKPRGADGIPDALRYGIPGKILDSKYSELASRSVAYVMRSSFSPRKIEKYTFIKIITRLLASVVVSVHFKRCLLVSAPKDLGHDPLFWPKQRSVLTMGYFQTFKYFELASNQEEIFLETPESQQIRYFKNLSNKEKPLVVHVRLGDYLLEESFGVLGVEYYSRAIAEVTSFVNVGKIWLFSDEPKKALLLIPEKWHSQVRIIEEIDGSPANTLEIMRFGHAYVIANSSFSWWAAYSSYEGNVPIIAPLTWFKGMPSPNALIPKSWVRVDSDFH